MGGIASSLGASFGIGGGPAAQGLNWQPGTVNLSNPATQPQGDAAYAAAQSGIANQQAFMQALQGQNGIANQSSVFSQMQDVANGQGPNPAQAMLAQSTSANTANQAALMAGQRGAGANAGLIARQAAQQGGANQQNAAGQAATMQADQSLGALNQLGGIAGQQVGQQAAATGALTGAQQSEQGLIYGQLDAQNTANLTQQKNLNDINSQKADKGAQAQAGIMSGITGGLTSMLAQGGKVTRQNYAYGTTNSTASPSLGVNTQLPASTIQPMVQPSGAPTSPSGPKSFIGKAAQALAPKAPGVNGSNDPNGLNNMYQSGQQTGNAIGSLIGKGLGAIFGGSSAPNDPNGVSQNASDPTAQAGYSSSPADVIGGTASDPVFNKGGKVPAMVSPGERYLNPREVEKVAKGEKSAVKAGEKIPGKAKVKGDSLKNDTVPKTLEEGGIVLPKSVMESKHPHWAAHKFVSAIINKKQGLPSRKK